MKYKAIISILIFTTLMWSCSDNQSPNDASDQSEILNVISDYENSDSLDFFFEDLNDQSEDNFGDEPNFEDPYNLFKPITPIRFGRIKVSGDRNISVELTSDTTAIAYFDFFLNGNFVIVAKDSDSTSQVASVYRKDMQHHSQRIANFEKITKLEEESGEILDRWKLVDFSMGYGESVNAPKTVKILNLLVESSQGDSVLITEPLNFMQSRADLFTFPRGTEVTLTVTVENTNPNAIIFPDSTTSTEIVRLHYGRNRIGHYGRKWFHWIGQDLDGNNIYRGSWIVAQRRGVHHAVIDVIDNGTIHDSDEDLYPYNSETWSTPYRVARF